MIPHYVSSLNNEAHAKPLTVRLPRDVMPIFNHVILYVVKRDGQGFGLLLWNTNKSCQSVPAPETAGSLGAWSVGLSFRDVTWSALHGAHHHADVSHWDLWKSELGIHQPGSRRTFLQPNGECYPRGLLLYLESIMALTNINCIMWQYHETSRLYQEQRQTGI